MTHHNVSGFEALMAGLYTNYEGAWGPHVVCKWALNRNCSTKVCYAAWLKKAWRKKVMKRKTRKLWQKRMPKLWQKKNWRKLTWGLTHQN